MAVIIKPSKALFKLISTYCVLLVGLLTLLFIPRSGSAAVIEEGRSQFLEEEQGVHNPDDFIIANSYGQSAYYGQGSYYGQSTYYAQSTYYGQSTYYAQSTYYSEGSYQTTFTTNVTTSGNFTVTGHISKGSGTFVIDHPLDPANKLLFHSFVESPDVKNIYDGVAILDENGEVVIGLPDYFDVLNKEYRYQVKALSVSMPNLYVKEEVADNKFIIAGGMPGGRVSWQVTGIRRDPYILANPIIPEVKKDGTYGIEKGEYLFEGYAEEGLGTRFSRLMRRFWFGFNDLF